MVEKMLKKQLSQLLRGKAVSQCISKNKLCLQKLYVKVLNKVPAFSIIPLNRCQYTKAKYFITSVFMPVLLKPNILRAFLLGKWTYINTSISFYFLYFIAVYENHIQFCVLPYTFA